MASIAVARPSVAITVPSAALVVFALLGVLFLLQENSLLLPAEAANYLHEATHDARHALGVPCH
jgi:hypothetical protein